jgi:hypothetical protein
MKEDRVIPVHFSKAEDKRVSGDLLSRRAALRRLGFTAGAGLFGMIAADDAARLVISEMQKREATRGVADALAKDFGSAGIASAQLTEICGVLTIGCIYYNIDPLTMMCSHPTPCGCEEPCLNCPPPGELCECMDVADWKFCNCLQAAANAYPCCADCNGTPLGNPSCSCTVYSFNVNYCGAVYRYDTDQC